MSVIDSDTQATRGRQAGVGRAGPRGMGVTVGVDTAGSFQYNIG